MNQITYTSQFNGRFEPANDNGTTLKGRTSAPRCTIVVEERARNGARVPRELGGAEIKSTVIYTSATTFQQYGTISFENSKDRLHFSTQGQGHIADDPSKTLKLGSAILRIDRGDGRFRQASGLITSNFVVNNDGEVTDNQVGVVQVR